MVPPRMYLKSNSRIGRGGGGLRGGGHRCRDNVLGLAMSRGVWQLNFGGHGSRDGIGGFSGIGITY